jgi:hypothetical protein
MVEQKTPDQIAAILRGYSIIYSIKTAWSPLRVHVVVDFLLGMQVAYEDADLIADQLNTELLNRLKEEEKKCYPT